LYRNTVSAKPVLIAMILLAYTASLNPPAAAKTEHSPIYITADSGFASGGFHGSGTEEDPYVIENLRIATDAVRRNGVEIRNTRAYFVIRDCEVTAAYIGVLVEGAAPGTAFIISNVIAASSHDGGGIVLGSDGVTVTNNTCTGFVEGLHTNYADRCAITYNNFSYNSYHGVSLRYSNENLVAHNTIVGNGAHGVLIVRDSAGNRIINNTFSGNSQMETYDWDDIYSFTVTSQGLDEGRGNHWSDEETLWGNSWSDYSGEGEYRIDGSANAVDRYPAKAQALTPTQGRSETEQGTGGGGVPGFTDLAMVLGALAAMLILFGLRRPGPTRAGSGSPYL
jgi:parallel beta-helix repeat protein